MLITIHNLPHDTQYSEIKSLIQSKCGLRDIILDKLLPEGATKKVTVGVADEGDAAMLVRNLNGMYMQNLQLFVEVLRQRQPEDQPYHNQSSNMKNNQHKTVAPSSTIPGMYENPSAQQMMMSQMRPSQIGMPQMGMTQTGMSQMGTSQMGLPQMVPPPLSKLDNFQSVSSMSLNYEAPLTSQVGFGIPHQYSNNNMVPTLVSYPMKQNLDYGFEEGNQQSSSNQNNKQSWGNFNSNTFNNPRQNNFASYSSNNQSRFDEKPSTRSRVDDRRDYTMQRGQAQKRKRSESPVNRQSYSRHGGSNWGNKNQSNSSGRKDSSRADHERPRSFNMYGSHVTNTSKRNEPSGTFKKGRWNSPPSRSSNFKERDHPPKSDFSNRRPNFDNAKKFKYSKNDTKEFASPKRISYETNKQSGIDPKTLNKTTQQQMFIVPFRKTLQKDKNERTRSAILITADILNNPTLKKTTCDVSDSVIHDALMQCVKARVILLTNSRYEITREFCFKLYRRKFPESDDQHLYNVIVNRCKRQTYMPKKEALDIWDNVKTGNVNAGNVKADKVNAGNVKADKVNAGNSTQQITNPSSFTEPPVMNQETREQVIPKIPKHPQGNKKIFQEHKRAAKLQFEQGPDVIEGDPAIKAAVQKEIDDINRTITEAFNELASKENDNIEKTFVAVYEKIGVNSKINQALQVQVLRRLLKTQVKPIIRINGYPKLPKKPALMEFLQNYKISSLKKSEKNPYYIATCESYKEFDELCQMGKVDIDNMSVYFKPMHLGGPPNKNARDKNITCDFTKELRNPNRAPPPAAFDEQSNVNKNTSNNATSTIISDDTELNQDVKVKDIKPEEQIYGEIAEIEGKNIEGIKEEMEVQKKEEAFNCGIKYNIDWPDLAEDDRTDWTEDVDIKEELRKDPVDKKTEGDVKNDKKGNVKVDETAANKTGNLDDSVIHTGDYEANDADDINMDELDDDDLEDY